MINRMLFWLKTCLGFNLSTLKYSIVGLIGVGTNLGTMTLFLNLGYSRGWMLSAGASAVSTVGNFILHNCWTFSDRQHQGVRLVRGFLSFSAVSAMGIALTTVFYIGFSRAAAHLVALNSHPDRLPLACQFAAILLASGTTYLLNREFTWPRLKSETLVESEADSTEYAETW